MSKGPWLDGSHRLSRRPNAYLRRVDRLCNHICKALQLWVGRAISPHGSLDLCCSVSCIEGPDSLTIRQQGGCTAQQPPRHGPLTCHGHIHCQNITAKRGCKIYNCQANDVTACIGSAYLAIIIGLICKSCIVMLRTGLNC